MANYLIMPYAKNYRDPYSWFPDAWTKRGTHLIFYSTVVMAWLGAEWGVGGTVVSESVLRSSGTLLSRVRTPPPAPWPEGGLKA
ncbi:hypothetical protein PoB_001278100 [Plakobranchus ocellatus]|uniref:Uncharacterized protein n=1 Tax=Plakobranchus ocellatus TaxID=259542 RepID=A0AAV3YV88_9GAST|nr:hypothetical protein PoB_001278100 [Plakobranchus ocellatus]